MGSGADGPQRVEGGAGEGSTGKARGIARGGRALALLFRMNVPESAGATPAMAQWFAVKAANPDALVFFRMGDFYELFFGDAETASAVLDIQLTKRGEHAGKPIQMCGVPAHSAQHYLSRLIRRGFRVALIEQLENPKERARGSKAPIRREMVRLITPGTVTEEALLDAACPNLLLSLALAGGVLGAAWLDVSTGSFETEALAPQAAAELLGRLDPAEILAPADLPLGDWEAKRAPAPAAPPPPLASRRQLAALFAVADLEAFGSFSDAEAMAAAGAIEYVRTTQAGVLPRLARPAPAGPAGRLALDAATRASLEIASARDGGTEHTLLAVVRQTLTGPGARLLAGWLAAPLTDPAGIAARQDIWSWLFDQQAVLAEVRSLLRGLPDLPRALGRLSLRRGSPRDLAGIGAAIAAGQAIATVLDGTLPAALQQAKAALTELPDLLDLLQSALVADPPARLDDGGVIAAGFDPELDAERRLRDDSRRLIAQLQMDLAQKHGVASLRIRHHAQLGYLIEVPATAAEKLRQHPDLVLRQGMAGGARFTSVELSELDERIAAAAARAAAREQGIFAHLLDAVLGKAEKLAALAEGLALIDVAQSCARLAEGGRWCRPLVGPGTEFCVLGGRHPVVEAALAGTASFVPNDCDLSPERRVLLLTGPNMAGKSTYIRQNALIVVLAQAGLPVPAAQARIGVVDRLFSRVGAADDLARGRSTFMVEMTETAAILHQAGPRSLVVVDEIGRGTATLDGLAIAWAVLEALHTQLRSRTIFATHFHELAGLRHELPCLAAHTMRVKEWKGEVIFLHEVEAGAAGRSWGVHVAHLAGLPAAVVRRAASLLAQLERRRAGTAAEPDLPLFANLPPPEAEEDPLLAALDGIDPDRLSPREALEALYTLKSLLPVQKRKEALPSREC